jgi:AraC-like DNA-binding protein
MTRFSAVLDLIEEVLDDDVRIADLASMTGLSVSRFAHAFKAAHGVAPYRYVLERRIERAMVLLRTGNETDRNDGRASGLFEREPLRSDVRSYRRHDAVGVPVGCGTCLAALSARSGTCAEGLSSRPHRRLVLTRRSRMG